MNFAEVSLGELALRWLAARLSPYLPPKRPRRPLAALSRQEERMLVYSLVLPAPGDPDVVKRTLKVTTAGVVQPDVDVTDPSVELKFEQGVEVTLALVDTDDAGNESPVSESYTFTTADTIAPGQPGLVSLSLIREE